MQQKTVLITGSSKGLGAALAELFASDGYSVIIHGRSTVDLERIQEKLARFMNGVSLVQGDIRERATLDLLEQAAREKNVSVVINNAGIGQHIPFGQISDLQIEEILFTNLLAPLKLTRRIYQFFAGKKSGTIININSMSGKENHSLRTLYCASKWGLRGFADTLKREAKEHNIRILDIYPTMIKTSPAYTEGMETRDVAQKIYAAFADTSLSELVIDGRTKK